MIQELRALFWGLSVHPACPRKRAGLGRKGGLGQLVLARSDPMPCLPTPNHSVCALS